MRRSEIDARLQELYEQIPQPRCKGLCTHSCGPIDMHPRERQRARERGVTIPHHDDAMDELARTGTYTCPALKDGLCSVYPVRSMICRQWGAIEALACPHGCRPEEGLLPDLDAMLLLQESLAIDMPDTALLDEQRRIIRKRMADPAFRTAYQEYVRNHRIT